MTLSITPTTDIDACRALRRTVFIEEQGIAEADEIDDLDGEAVHLLALQDGQPVGTARLLRKGDSGKIGRVCVLADARGRGIGAALIRAAVETFRGLGLRQAKLGAQAHALGFYAALGFEAVGEVYEDAGIAHRDMILML